MTDPPLLYIACSRIFVVPVIRLQKLTLSPVVARVHWCRINLRPAGVLRGRRGGPRIVNARRCGPTATDQQSRRNNGGFASRKAIIGLPNRHHSYLTQVASDALFATR